MKKLILIILLLPLFAKAQVNGSIQRTAATGVTRYFNSGAAGIDTLASVTGNGVNGYVLVYNSTLKKSVWTNPTGFGTNFWSRNSGTSTLSPAIPNDNLTMGTGSITGGVGSFTSSGSTGAATITQSSGSGVGLTITKGGNGEGLIVNKTSGSGNAVTVTGTAEATTLVKTGGTGAQFLMGNGTTQDTTTIQTVANFFPKGDTRYLKTSGGLSFGTFGSTPNAQGGSYSGGVITLQPASASFPGGVTTGTQTFAGLKTFNDQITVSTSTATSTIAASSTNSGGRVITLLGESSLEPLAVVQKGSGMLAAFTTTDGMTSTDKVLIRNNGSIYTRGQLEVGNLLVGDAADSVMVHRAIDLTVRRVPTTGTGSAVFSASPTFTGTPTIPTPFTLGVTSVTGVTGTGQAVLDTDPTIFNSIIGGTASIDPRITFQRNNSISSGIRGDVSFSNSSSSTVALIRAEAITDNVGTALEFYTRPAAGSLTNVAILSSTGALRLNTYGSGTLTTDASGNVTATSDERMKNISGFYTTGLSALKGIKPITYKWKSATKLDTKEFYTGFSAQNIHQNIPQAAGKMANGDLTIQDRPIMATMINAINELNAIIEKQDARILALEKLFLELKNK